MSSALEKVTTRFYPEPVTSGDYLATCRPIVVLSGRQQAYLHQVLLIHSGLLGVSCSFIQMRMINNRLLRYSPKPLIRGIVHELTRREKLLKGAVVPSARARSQSSLPGCAPGLQLS